jgi:hypothetical protein
LLFSAPRRRVASAVRGYLPVPCARKRIENDQITDYRVNLQVTFILD